MMQTVRRQRADDAIVLSAKQNDGKVAEVEAEGVIKPTGHVYRQNYVVFLRAAGGKIVFLREYFDPVRAAKAMDLPIAGVAS